MKQQDKELLLKDLSARLPYGVMCQTDEHGKIHKLKGINKHKGIWWYEFDGFRNIKPPKPYLRPMSSMTEEEKNVYLNTFKKSIIGTDKEDGRVWTIDSIDYLNSHYFDYRGLIEKGLAVEVTEENNPYKE